MAISQEQQQENEQQAQRTDAELFSDIASCIASLIDYAEGFYPQEDFDEDGDPVEEDEPMLWARALSKEMMTRPSCAFLRDTHDSSL